MSRKHYSTKLFYKYYMDWIKLYKEKAVRKVTLDKWSPVNKIDNLNRDFFVLCHD